MLVILQKLGRLRLRVTVGEIVRRCGPFMHVARSVICVGYRDVLSKSG